MPAGRRYVDFNSLPLAALISEDVAHGAGCMSVSTMRTVIPVSSGWMFLGSASIAHVTSGRDRWMALFSSTTSARSILLLKQDDFRG